MREHLSALLARRVRPRMRWLADEAVEGSGRAADTLGLRSRVTFRAAYRQAQAAAVCDRNCHGACLSSVARCWSVTLFGRVAHASLGRARGNGGAAAVAVGQ